MITDFLIQQDFSCDSAYSGTEAKLLLKDTDYTLIVFDNTSIPIDFIIYFLVYTIVMNYLSLN